MIRASCILLLAVAVAAVMAAPPTLPQSFTVVEEDSISIHQGQYTTLKDGAICCLKNSEACKVRRETEAGNFFRDATKKMTAFQALGTPQVIVNDYNTGKEYNVVNGKCQAYCPLQDNEMGTFGIGPNATSVGTKVINGVTCNGYKWKVTILGIITMETDTMYVDESDPSNVKPCAQNVEITPFGQDVGSETSTWTKFVAGEPNPKIFEFANKDSCEESNQCNDNASQIRYLRNKQYLTYLKAARGLEL